MDLIEVGKFKKNNIISVPFCRRGCLNYTVELPPHCRSVLMETGPGTNVTSSEDNLYFIHCTVMCPLPQQLM